MKPTKERILFEYARRAISNTSKKAQKEFNLSHKQALKEINNAFKRLIIIKETTNKIICPICGKKFNCNIEVLGDKTKIYCDNTCSKKCQKAHNKLLFETESPENCTICGKKITINNGIKDLLDFRKQTKDSWCYNCIEKTKGKGARKEAMQIGYLDKKLNENKM